MTTRLLLSVGALAAVALSAACGSTRAADASYRPTACAGTRYVEVRNDLGTPVDVYAYTRGPGGSPRFLGTASVGTSRIVLTEEFGYMFARVGTRNVTGNRGASNRVTFDRGCDAT